MRLTLLCSLCIPLWLAGCATPQASLQVQTLTIGQPAPKPLAVGGTLYNGDQFVLQIEVPQAVYVYALRSGTPQPKRIFPVQGHTLVPPNVPRYIPAEGEFLALDAGPGRDAMFVVASVRQLADTTLFRMIAETNNMKSRDAGSDNEADAAQTENSAPNAGAPAPSQPSSPSQPTYPEPPGDYSTPSRKKDPQGQPRETGPIPRPGTRYVVKAALDSQHDAVLRFDFAHKQR